MFQRVLIAGIGALGSEVAKNVGLLGCKSVYLADPDVIEQRNVGRSVLTSEPAAIGRRKVDHALGQLRSWFPQTRWNGHSLEIADVDAEQFYGADVLFSCVDTDLARTEIAALSARYHVPVADGGLGGTSIRVGRVSWFAASGTSACFSCLLSRGRRAALLSTWESEVHACWTGSTSSRENDDWTTTPSMASIVAGLQVEVARCSLDSHECAAFSQQVDLDRTAAIERIEHHRSSGCPFHDEIPEALFPTCTLAECSACGHHYAPNCRIGWLRRWGSCPCCGSRDLVVRESLRSEPTGSRS